MKFQVSHIAKFVLVAAMSLSAFNMVGAQSETTTEPIPTIPTPTLPLPTLPTLPTIPTPTIPTIPTCGISLMECEPVVVATPAPAKPAVVNYEENVSFNDSDLGVTLFKSVDADGNQQMDLFSIQDGTHSGTYMFSVTKADIAPYMTDHPAQNTLIASGKGVAVYVLTTGEIQVNAGPDAEGKYHVKIFNGIPWTHVYGYTIDPK